MDCSLPGSSDHGNSQARITEWTAISFSRGSSQPRNWTQVYFIAGDSLQLSFLESPPRDLGVPKESDGQGGLVCYDSWGRKELDTTERLNWTEMKESEGRSVYWPENGTLQCSTASPGFVEEHGMPYIDIMLCSFIFIKKIDLTAVDLSKQELSLLY